MDNEIKLFENYISGFDKSNEKILYKYQHTYRVVSYAKEIAKSLDLDETEYNRACVCALFHDIGRFPQIKEFNTFNDLISFDHGDKGEEVLTELGYGDDIVHKAVKYHNKKVVPKFDELTDMHCKLVRDADKLDIMIHYLDNPIDNDLLPDYSTIDLFKEHKLLDNADRDTAFEEAIAPLAYIFDINFKKTIKILIENDYINKKINRIRNDKNNLLVNYIEDKLKEYIKERFDVEC